ncbi:MATE family efflux transporter [Enterocloster clostridioformis]|uniref:MATE family efflux transporter n=1 Tax=Enterocloster clostridioformis TaxID=1531 RepID=UPI00080CB7DD|nr:MATE family efflux transporter [Enterocloster clostridioformis]ANU45597.1 MATE family efflux transporter [Lachnoclostridium sp. YL32]NDO27376.1 MATE family efflux transporter [Enterocloster clostridioformis]OXE61655.1 MATE family efflux transporter [Enterocloster clostridioformis]QQQ99645.1 MATE family efflux transporter [Enterocloster clostridioformis]
MEGKVAKKNRITEGSIFGQLLLFFFPILFGTFFQQLYNTADAMVVGRFVGKQALAAVGGSTSTLINLLVGFFVGLSSGATVVISQFYGARKADKVHWAVHTSIAFSVIGGIIFMIVGLVGSPWALETMKTPEDVMGHAVVYIRIYFLGIIVNLVYNMGAGILRAVGDSRRPLYFLIASCFTNIILDVLLVAVLRMGVAGAALATITSQLLSAILVVRALMKTDDMYKLEWKKVRIDQRMLQRIVRIGIPAGMQSVMYNISNVIIQAGVNTLGTDNVTAWATYGKVDGLYWMMINALGISATTFVGQNFGAGRLDRVRKGAGACMVIGVVLTASVGVVLYNGGHLLVELFTTDRQVQAISMDLLHFMVPTFITYIAIEILSGTLRGVGDAWMPLVITGIGVCAVRVLWIMFVLPHYHTIIGAAFCYPLTWSLTTVAFVIYYYFFSSLRRWKLKPLKKRFGVYKPF